MFDDTGDLIQIEQYDGGREDLSVPFIRKSLQSEISVMLRQ